MYRTGFITAYDPGTNSWPPLEGALVEIISPGGTALVSTVTDCCGNWSIDLEQGDGQMMFSATGYETFEVGTFSTWMNGASVSLKNDSEYAVNNLVSSSIVAEEYQAPESMKSTGPTFKEVGLLVFLLLVVWLVARDGLQNS